MSLQSLSSLYRKPLMLGTGAFFLDTTSYFVIKLLRAAPGLFVGLASRQTKEPGRAAGAVGSRYKLMGDGQPFHLVLLIILHACCSRYGVPGRQMLHKILGEEHTYDNG